MVKRWLVYLALLGLRTENAPMELIIPGRSVENNLILHVAANSFFEKSRQSSLHYFDVRHSDGNKGWGKLLIAERHDQPPDHVAPSGFDKSSGAGIAASG